MDLGYPILNVATEAADGSSDKLIEDGIVEVEGYERIIITQTESNADSGLKRINATCANETQIYINEF